MFRLIAVIALLVVGIGATVYAVAGGTSAAQPSSQYLSAAATRTNVAQTAVATGNLAAAETYGLSFGGPAQIVSSTASSPSSGSGGVVWTVKSVAVAVGDHVAAGAVLAQADTTSAEAALATARANLQAAQDKLTTDQAGATETQRAQAAASVASAKEQLEAAKENYADTLVQNDLSIASAKTTVTNAQTKHDDDVAAGVATAQITTDSQQLTQAWQQLSAARANASGAKHRAAQQVTSAASGVKSAILNQQSSTQPATTAQLASDQAQVTSAQQAVADAETTVAGSALTAPVAGTVTAVNIRAGTSAASGYAIELASDQLQVTADFTESDLPSIALGQPATVAVTAVGDRIDGTVAAIAPQSATGGSGAVVTYAVTISLPSPPATVRAGMSVQTTITTAQAANVVAVPSVALHGVAGNYSVQVLDTADAVQTVPVTVGLVSNGLAEIRSGLNEGERVVTGTVSARQGTTTTTGGGIVVPGGLGGGGGFTPGGAGGGRGNGSGRTGTGTGGGTTP